MEEDFVDHLHRRLCDFHREYFKYYARWTGTENETITFPLWTVNGRLCGYQRYQWNADKLRNNDCKGKYFTYRTKEVLTCWGLEHIDLTSTEPLYVVEGIWDAISVLSTGRRCIAVLSNNPQQLKPWLSCLPCETIALCDGDKAGKMLTRVCDRGIILPEGKDCNDMTTDELEVLLSE